MTESKICTCPSGDGSLRWPCPKHPAVEQACGDERAKFECWASDEGIYPKAVERSGNCYKLAQTQSYWMAWQARAALAQPSQSQYEASFEEWLANELEGEDGQPVPAAVCDIALARRAFNHWPKLEQPAKVGGVRFSAGVSSRLVVEAAQRLYEFEVTPEKEAERIERLQAFREQLDPLNLAPHAEAFNEAPADALRPEQAEAERPTYECTMGVGGGDGNLFVHGDHASIKAAQKIVLERDATLARVAEMESVPTRHQSLCAKHAEVIRERDELRGKLAELEKQEPVALANRGLHAFWVKWTEAAAGLYGPGIKLYAAPVAQARQLNDLDKQCRDDVARALGLRPNQERGFAWSYLLASIKSCVKASGDSAQAQHSVPGIAESVSVRKAASGAVKHLNNGLCPDDIEGHEARDPDCPVCRALIETGKESDNV